MQRKRDGPWRAFETIDLIIPVYNEEEILESQLLPVLESAPGNLCVTVVENGSTDRTREMLRSFEERYPSLRVIRLQEPSYGNAVRTGLESSSREILMVDDLDVLDREFWEAGLGLMASGGVDIVQGSKVLAGRNDRRPFVRRAATRVLTALLRIMLGFRGTDTHGPKIMRRESVEGIFPLCGSEPDLYPSELMILAQRRGLVIKELPIKLSEIRATPLALSRRVPRALRDLVLLRRKLGGGRRAG